MRIGPEPSGREDAGVESPERRTALRAIAKYTMLGVGTSTVVLSADDAVAKKACSQHNNPRPGNNCIPSAAPNGDTF